MIGKWTLDLWLIKYMHSLGLLTDTNDYILD